MNLNSRFRDRIGFPIDHPITLANLNTLLEQTAAAIPFENICTISGDISELKESSLVELVPVEEMKKASVALGEQRTKAARFKVPVLGLAEFLLLRSTSRQFWPSR